MFTFENLEEIFKTRRKFAKKKQWQLCSQRFHLKRYQHVSKSLKNWIANTGNKLTKSPSEI